jgi:hypothetical protein
MPVYPPLVLIVDGNNLAHHLYQFSTHNPVSTDEIQLMAMQLSMYVRSARRPVVVELCLDHYDPDHLLPVLGGVLVFVASVHEEADDLLRQRFRFHHHQDHPCLVVTNDRQIREDVQEEGGSCLLVYDFVRRQGKKPVFRDPFDFPTLTRRGKSSELAAPIRIPLPARPPRIPAHPLPKFETPVPQPPPPKPVEEPPAERLKPSRPVAASETQPTYRLTLESWPLEAGVRFLVESFCPQHGAEYRDLYRSLKGTPLVQADLVQMAAALVASCGTESGFAARGSLIDRVRLALLLSPNEDVPLSVVAERTGYSPKGLHGRIKDKARGWLKTSTNPSG